MDGDSVDPMRIDDTHDGVVLREKFLFWERDEWRLPCMAAKYAKCGKTAKKGDVREEEKLVNCVTINQNIESSREIQLWNMECLEEANNHGQ